MKMTIIQKQFENIINEEPYKNTITITRDFAKCILGLLKEHEAVKPYVTGRGKTFEASETWWYACGNCNSDINPRDKFCHECGIRVKWDE